MRAYGIRTELGRWEAGFSDRGLCRFALPGLGSLREREGLPELEGQEGRLGRSVRERLRLRLAGEAAELPWESFDLEGVAPFSRRLLAALHRIPRGEVRTYGWAAREAGSPAALRAAGQACGNNPIVLFIPCHRIVAAQGPGGFGGGLEWKQRLLELEGFDWSAVFRGERSAVSG